MILESNERCCRKEERHHTWRQWQWRKMMLRIKLKLRTELWIVLRVEDMTLDKTMSKRHKIQPENKLWSISKGMLLSVMMVCEQVWFHCKVRNATESTKNAGKGDDGISGRCSVEWSTSVLKELRLKLWEGWYTEFLAMKSPSFPAWWLPWVIKHILNGFITCCCWPESLDAQLGFRVNVYSKPCDIY